MIQLLIRQAAKEAYMQVDSCQKIRKAMWYGPARVLAYEGRSSLWLVHGGVTMLVAETSCRSSSSEEIFRKKMSSSSDLSGSDAMS